MAAIQSMLLVYFLSKRINNRGLLLVGCGFYTISLFRSFYQGFIENSLIDIVLSPLSYILQPPTSFISAVIFIILGKILAENYSQSAWHLNKYYIMALIIIVLLGVIEVTVLRSECNIYFQNSYIALVPFTYLSIKMMLGMNSQLPSTVINFLRSSSILIYLSHPVFVFINKTFLDIGLGIGLSLLSG